MRTCPCGFEAANNIPPTSPLWHRQHRAHHLARYPDVDQDTQDALEELIYKSEHASLVAFVQGMSPIDGGAMHERMSELLATSAGFFGGDPVHVMTALVGAVGAFALNTSIADKLIEIAIASLTNVREQLNARVSRIGGGAVLS